FGMEAVVPEADDFATVDRIIWTELIDGKFTDESRAAYNGAIARLQRRGCDAAALVCTEIPLLVREDECPLPTLDSTRLLARAALAHALAPGRRRPLQAPAVEAPHLQPIDVEPLETPHVDRAEVLAARSFPRGEGAHAARGAEQVMDVLLLELVVPPTAAAGPCESPSGRVGR